MSGVPEINVHVINGMAENKIALRIPHRPWSMGGDGHVT